jgi:hypothetical protein
LKVSRDPSGHGFVDRAIPGSVVGVVTRASASDVAGALSDEAAKTDKPTVDVEGRELRLSNLTKVLYP